MVLIDIQKAFDTADHGILLDKLKALGLSQEAMWFNSYLTGRQQVVNVNGHMSFTTLNAECLKDQYLAHFTLMRVTFFFLRLMLMYQRIGPNLYQKLLYKGGDTKLV